MASVRDYPKLIQAIKRSGKSEFVVDFLRQKIMETFGIVTPERVDNHVQVLSTLGYIEYAGAGRWRLGKKAMESV
jgi:DNA-binding IclR family transcriptional regulator